MVTHVIPLIVLLELTINQSVDKYLKHLTIGVIKKILIKLEQSNLDKVHRNIETSLGQFIDNLVVTCGC